MCGTGKARRWLPGAPPPGTNTYMLSCCAFVLPFSLFPAPRMSVKSDRKSSPNDVFYSPSLLEIEHRQLALCRKDRRDPCCGHHYSHASVANAFAADRKPRAFTGTMHDTLKCLRDACLRSSHAVSHRSPIAAHHAVGIPVAG